MNENEEFEFCSSEKLEIEIQNTFKKKKLQKYISDDIIKVFWLSFHLRVTTIKTISTITVCRDPKDNFLLALAKDSNADFLITGDKDLLILEKFENTIICTLTDFIDKYLKR